MDRRRRRRPNIAALIFVLWVAWALLGWTQLRTTQTTLHDGIRTTAHVDAIGQPTLVSRTSRSYRYGGHLSYPVRLAFTTTDGRRATKDYVMPDGVKIGDPVAVVYRRDLSDIEVVKEANSSTTTFWAAFTIGTLAAIAGLLWALPFDAKRFNRGRAR